MVLQRSHNNKAIEFKRPNLGHIINSDGHSKKAIHATNKAITSIGNTLRGQTKHKISKVKSALCASYNVKFTTSELMQTSDGPINPRTRRVLKNRQVKSDSFIRYTHSLYVASTSCNC